MNWFECKISYEKEDTKSGTQRKASAVYLQRAESFTEAEKRLSMNLSGYPSFTVEGIRKQKFAEFFRVSTAERFYKAKVGFITLDEKAGVEKKKYVNMLLQADDLAKALDRLEQGMADSIADYEVASITETAIVDVFDS